MNKGTSDSLPQSSEWRDGLLNFENQPCLQHGEKNCEPCNTLSEMIAEMWDVDDPSWRTSV